MTIESRASAPDGATSAAGRRERDRVASFLRANFFVATDFPDQAFRLPAVTRDLGVRRPRYLIFERRNSESEMGRAVDRLHDDSDVARLLAAYRRETQIEDFTLYRRID